MASEPHLVVTGPMGIGKSTTAKAVAAALRIPWYDSDRDLETLFGCTGAELVDTHGVDELHRLESSVLLGRLLADHRSVVSAAAWVVEDERCRAALRRRAHVVVLDAPTDVILTRMRSSDHRRTITRSEVHDLATRRAPLFAAVADLTLDATRPTLELVAEITAHTG